MTCDEFEMNAHYSSWRQRTQWQIKARDGGMTVEMDVDDDVMQECISDNFDYVIDTVGKDITDRVFNMNDLGQITDEEMKIFNKIMLMVVGE